MVDGLTYIPFQPGPGLVESIASHIEHQIVAGILRSGDRIQESRIVGQLAVSRGSVRESFRLLESRRLIDVIPRNPSGKILKRVLREQYPAKADV